MSSNYTNKALSLEQLRDYLGKMKLFDEFVGTYSETCPSIKNTNSCKLWDRLNQNSLPTYRSNPMGFDRVELIKSWIISYLKNGSKILNVGFGGGNLEENMGFEYARYSWFGIDISKKSVVRMRKKFSTGSFQTGNILNIPFKDGEFDGIVVSEVMEHISPSDTFSALGEVYRVIKKGGYLFLSVPMNEQLEKLILQGKNLNAHVRDYTVSILEAELNISNFRILKKKKLSAFKKFYKMKSWILSFIPFVKKCNNLIILAQKP